MTPEPRDSGFEQGGSRPRGPKGEVVLEQASGPSDDEWQDEAQADGAQSDDWTEDTGAPLDVKAKPKEAPPLYSWLAGLAGLLLVFAFKGCSGG
jgi:hypothetical protein